ncbi:MAG: sulfatase-like hydrolase/transferase [Cyclobacteriaceae bacterium]
MKFFRTPISFFGLASLLCTVLTLLSFYFLRTSAEDVFQDLIPGLVYHTFFIGTVVLVLYSLASLFRRISSMIEWLAHTIFIVILAMHSTDLVLQWLANAKLTPQLIGSYGLKYIFHPDMINALNAHQGFAISVPVLLLILYLLLPAYKKISRDYEYISPRYCLAATGVSVLILLVLYQNESIYQKAFRPAPLEFLTKEEAAKPLDQNQRELAFHLLKEIKTTDHLNEAFPLQSALTNENINPVVDKPDIFFIVIESLKGSYLKLANSTDPADTPNIDSLAAISHIYPRMIANGQPTQEGFFILNTSVIPHKKRKIGASFKSNHFKALPEILKDEFNYETTIYWASTPAERNTKYWSDKWFGNVLYPNSGNDKWHENYSDIVFYEKVIEEIKASDSKGRGQPLFMYIQNDDTHYPFKPDINFFENQSQLNNARQFVTSGDIEERYKKTLSWTDYNLGKLLRFLGNRPNAGNTIIVLTGDHAKSIGSETGVRLAPNNQNLHTGALIFGPEHLVGSPSENVFPSSHVDIMPTILDILNYQKPVTGFGKSLLEPNIDRYALAVSNNIFRLDFDNNSLFVNGQNLNDSWLQSFDGHSVEGFPNDEKRQLSKQLFNLIHHWSYILENDSVYDSRPQPTLAVNQ